MAMLLAPRTLSRISRIYVAVAVFMFVPFYFFGGAFFGDGIGGTLQIIRDEIAYFRPLAWLTFVLPPLLFLAELLLWRLGKARRPTTLAVLAGVSALLIAAAVIFLRFSDPPWAGDLLRGAYRMEDGRILVINSSPVAALDFWLSDGTRAMTWTGDQLNFSGTTCIGTGGMNEDFYMVTSSADAKIIAVRMRNEDEQQAQRLGLKEIPLAVVSDGITLSGRLVVPHGAGPVPLIVFPEGETTVSSLENEHEHHLLAGMGHATFIYDARGVGESGGRRTKDAERLLRDASAALVAARKAGGGRISRVGVYGASFAAKVAAAENVDFAILVAPLAVDRELVGRSGVMQLYVIPGADKEAPAKPLVEALRSFQALGRPVDIAIYPGTEYSILRSENRDGRRCHTGKARSYYKLIDSWIRTGTVSPEPDVVPLPRRNP